MQEMSCGFAHPKGQACPAPPTGPRSSHEGHHHCVAAHEYAKGKALEVCMRLHPWRPCIFYPHPEGRLTIGQVFRSDLERMNNALEANSAAALHRRGNMPL